MATNPTPLLQDSIVCVLLVLPFLSNRAELNV